MTDLELAMSRTWAEINLDDLARNTEILRKTLTPSAKFLAVVKANAYGHGMTQCARKLQDSGADWLAVATVPEGAELRENGITLPILCLGQTQPGLAPLMAEFGITQAVGDVSNAKALSDYAASSGKVIRIHIKIDTGMSRTGFYWPGDPEDKERTARGIMTACGMPGLYAEGMFTHFAAADGDSDFTRTQLARLLEAREYLRGMGQNFELVHSAASVGILDYPAAHLDMGRFGLVLYGYASTETGNEDSTLGLHPVMTVKSRITAVRSLPAGTTISYGRTYRLTRDSIMAVLPMGYADGMPRILSNNYGVKIHDAVCPIRGRVCMDMMMADVTDVPGVKAGDVATVFDGELMPIAAKNAGTIIHEIVCSPSARVPRVYIDGGKMAV
ncbi:MAG: alanine racemase [Synergistaceae bacterium]|nr:alanine racemase [Synergistaceae bacterium]